MVSRVELTSYIDALLDVKKFKDYAPNGLQVEGKDTINAIVTGVSACQALIDKAIKLNADAILVHHGFFWKNESPTIEGMKKNRIQSLLANDINLLGYHLPLDAHIEYGNNAQLAKKLKISDAKPVVGIAQDLIWQGVLKVPVAAENFAATIDHALDRKPLFFGNTSNKISRVAWCTGGAQDYINIAADLGVDAFISGEVSEKTYYQALEQGMVYFSAGHHATEKFGIQALGEHLASKFDLRHAFVDMPNPV